MLIVHSNRKWPKNGHSFARLRQINATRSLDKQHCKLIRDFFDQPCKGESLGRLVELDAELWLPWFGSHVTYLGFCFKSWLVSSFTAWPLPLLVLSSLVAAPKTEPVAQSAVHILKTRTRCHLDSVKQQQWVLSEQNKASQNKIRMSLIKKKNFVDEEMGNIIRKLSCIRNVITWADIWICHISWNFQPRQLIGAVTAVLFQAQSSVSQSALLRNEYLLEQVIISVKKA